MNARKPLSPPLPKGNLAPVMQARGFFKTWWWRGALILLGMLLILLTGAWFYLRGSLPQLDGMQTVSGLHGTVTVARDALGVPLISGADRTDVAYATGFVHGQERFFQMDILRRMGAGEMAEWFGPGGLEIDQARRLHRFRARAELAVNTLPPSERLVLERYVAGVNDGLSRLSAHPFEYALLGQTPKPWSSADSMLVAYAMYFDLQEVQAGRKLARGWLKAHCRADQLAFLLPELTQWDAPLDAEQVGAPAAPIPDNAPDWWGKPPPAPMVPLAVNDFGNVVGSNNWAVAGSRTTSGSAIVANDMHLPLNLPNTWYRLALQYKVDGTPRRVVGVSIPGMPFVVVGSNGKVAWGFTNSYSDVVDLIALETRPDGHVKTRQGWEQPQVHEERILVKQGPPLMLQVRETSLGPLREIDGHLYAIHWIAHVPGAVNLNLLELESAQTTAQALTIATTLGIPAQNIIVGDDAGDIGWSIAGALPKRTQSGMPATFPISIDQVDAIWQSRLAPQDYPQVRNPVRGQLWTANNRQLIHGAEMLTDGGFDVGARSQQIRNDLTMLGARTDLHAVYAIALDDRAVFLLEWRKRAIAALDAEAVAGHPQRAEFLRQLRDSWDGHASPHSVGYRLTSEFLNALYDAVFGAVDFDMSQLYHGASVATATANWPVVLARLIDGHALSWLPHPYANWQAAQLDAIDRVIAQVTQDGMPLSEATWGQRTTARIALPLARGIPVLGHWLMAPPDQLRGGRFMPRIADADFGQSERLTVSPGKEEEGMFNMPGGQSEHPLSPFFLAGHEDWVEGRPEPLLPGPARYTLTLVGQ